MSEQTCAHIYVPTNQPFALLFLASESCRTTHIQRTFINSLTGRRQVITVVCHPATQVGLCVPILYSIFFK